MTVKELIRKLRPLPPDTVVMAWSDGNESHAYEVTEIDEDKVRTERVVMLSD